MLMVRQVITTMKAAILCALILSALIIAFYLLRLLVRCVAKCKQRADLREWFWHIEGQAAAGQKAADSKAAAEAKRNSTDDGPEAGSLHVNRKQQFGKSWDDSAIERKTLLSDMIHGPNNKLRRHRKKGRTSSVTYGVPPSRLAK